MKIRFDDDPVDPVLRFLTQSSADEVRRFLVDIAEDRIPTSGTDVGVTTLPPLSDLNSYLRNPI